LAETSKETGCRGGIDDSSILLFSEVWPCSSSTLIGTLDMNIHNKVPVLVLHILEADIPKDARIVDQNVDAPEVLDSGLNDLLAICYAVVVGYGFTACSFDLIHHNIGSLLLGSAMLVFVLEVGLRQKRTIASDACAERDIPLWNCLLL